jgi:hypothetical protein
MGAGNLTHPQTSRGLETCKIARKIGLLDGSSKLGGALSIITVEAGPPGFVRPQAVEGVEPGNRHAAEVGSQLLDETLVYL